MNIIDLLDEKLLDYATSSLILSVEEYETWQKTKSLSHIQYGFVEDIVASVWNKCNRHLTFQKYIEFVESLGLISLGKRLKS